MATEQRNFFTSVWDWLRDAENRKVVAWLGSGLVVLFSAFLYQSVGPPSDQAAASQSATANNGIAVIGDVKTEGDIVINDGLEEDVESPQR